MRVIFFALLGMSFMNVSKCDNSNEEGWHRWSRPSSRWSQPSGGWNSKPSNKWNWNGKPSNSKPSNKWNWNGKPSGGGWYSWSKPTKKPTWAPRTGFPTIIVNSPSLFPSHSSSPSSSLEPSQSLAPSSQPSESSQPSGASNFAGGWITTSGKTTWIFNFQTSISAADVGTVIGVAEKGGLGSILCQDVILNTFTDENDIRIDIDPGPSFDLTFDGGTSTITLTRPNDKTTVLDSIDPWDC